jgi:hypothetical protein
MTRLLVVMTGMTTFLMCFVAVREHAALVRLGYRLSALERQRDRARMETARAREKVSRLRTPKALAGRAEVLGFARRYPRENPVVRVRIGWPVRRFVVRNE